MLRFEATTRAVPEQVWPLLARPGRWHEWAPHIRGAVGLGRPEVEPGRRGVVLVGLAAPVPAKVSAKVPGRSWDWLTGPVRIRHAVEPLEPVGSAIRIEVAAPTALETVIALGYGPVIRWVLGRLAERAAEV